MNIAVRWSQGKRIWFGASIGIGIACLTTVYMLSEGKPASAIVSISSSIITFATLLSAFVSPETWVVPSRWTVCEGVNVLENRHCLRESNLRKGNPLTIDYFEEMRRTRQAGYYLSLTTDSGRRIWIYYNCNEHHVRKKKRYWENVLGVIE